MVVHPETAIKIYSAINFVGIMLETASESRLLGHFFIYLILSNLQEEIFIRTSNGIPVVDLIYIYSLCKSCHYVILDYIQWEKW